MGEVVHRAAECAFAAAVRRRVSLVDRVGLEVILRPGLDAASAFDRDFEYRGFRTGPRSGRSNRRS